MSMLPSYLQRDHETLESMPSSELVSANQTFNEFTEFPSQNIPI